MTTTFKTEAVGRLGLSGFLTYHDKDGAVIKTVEMTGSIPLSEAGLNLEQATEFIDAYGRAVGRTVTRVEITNEQKDDHGPDDQQ
jgi:hypothetical protein